MSLGSFTKKKKPSTRQWNFPARLSTDSAAHTRTQHAHYEIIKITTFLHIDARWQVVRTYKTLCSYGSRIKITGVSTTVSEYRTCVWTARHRIRINQGDRNYYSSLGSSFVTCVHTCDEVSVWNFRCWCGFPHHPSIIRCGTDFRAVQKSMRTIYGLHNCYACDQRHLLLNITLRLKEHHIHTEIRAAEHVVYACVCMCVIAYVCILTALSAWHTRVPSRA